MALNIKNSEVERLATEVALLAKESKTEAIRRALLARRSRLKMHGSAVPRAVRIERFLRDQVWPKVPANVRGKGISKDEQEEILGLGPEGY